jgi:hypothetical protein
MRAHPQVVPAALGAIVGTLAYYGSMLLLHNYHVLIPAAPLAVLPVAVLTGAAGAVAGALLAGWALEHPVEQSLPDVVPTPRGEPVVAGASNTK